ncbi:MAG: hypothetical protein OEV92_13360 [Nitrospinota bacterium]|nr:hypothetical protein [Nitrospinota bacterium]
MLDKYFPDWFSLALASMGYLFFLLSLVTIFHFIAIGPFDLRPWGAPVYVEDLRNPVIILISGATILALFNEHCYRTAIKTVPAIDRWLNRGTE